MNAEIEHGWEAATKEDQGKLEVDEGQRRYVCWGWLNACTGIVLFDC